MRHTSIPLHVIFALLAAGIARNASAYQASFCGEVRPRALRSSSSYIYSRGTIDNRRSFAGARTTPAAMRQSCGWGSSSGKRRRRYFSPLRRGLAGLEESLSARQHDELLQRRLRLRWIFRGQRDEATVTFTGEGDRTRGEVIGGAKSSIPGVGAAGVGVAGQGDGDGEPTPAVATGEKEAKCDKRPPRKRFRGLLADRFQHPFDLEATAILRRLPGLELAIRSAVPAIEDVVYMENIANSILVGPRQMASLHKLLVEACRVLDMQVPDMYIRQNPQPNAYTLAIRGKKPFIVLHTSLLDLMEPEEVQAVIAHELGHLKCEHGIWVTLATVLANGLYRGGILGAFLADRLGLRRRLMRWSRAAEFTCDRAAMLVAQDVNVVVSTLLKLAGGSVSQASELSVSEFLKQASAYELASQSRIGRLLRNSQSMELTHPLPVIRARELVNFSKSPQYLGLVRRGLPL